VLFGIINLLLGNCEFFGFFKILFGFFLSVTFYNYLFIHYNFDYKKIFSLYLNGIVICAYIGFIELISFRIGFTPGYNYSWLFNKWGLHPGSIFGLRLNSIFSEPSQFALMLLPAVFISVEHLISRKYSILSFFNCIVVCLAMIFTTSSTGYIGVFFILVILAINYERILYILYFSILGVLAYFALYRWVDDFRVRVDTSVNLWTKEQFTIDDINSSSFVLYNNVNVMKKSFSDNPFIGRGLGSYELAYEKYSLTKEEDFLIKEGFDFNSKDGNSLLLRCVVELGLLGILFWLFFIPKYFVKKNNSINDLNNDDLTWVYNGAVLTILLGYLLRQGNYFINGFPFFCLFYYYSCTNPNPIKEIDDSEES
ncbi:MAG: O-antigen ligase family protein, partial [Bacteroidota bacterium]